MHGKAFWRRNRDRHTAFMEHYGSDRLMDQEIQKPQRLSTRTPKGRHWRSMSRQVITATIWRQELDLVAVRIFILCGVSAVIVMGDFPERFIKLLQKIEHRRQTVPHSNRHRMELGEISIACLHSTDRQLDPQKT